MGLEHILTYVQNNQFLSGGFVLGAISIIIAYARSLPNKLFWAIVNYFSIVVEIHSDDELFKYINTYYAKRPIPRFTRSFRGMYRDEDDLNDAVIITLGEGRHWYRDNGTFVVCERENATDGRSATRSSRDNMEKFTIRFFTRQLSIVRKIIQNIIITSIPDYSTVKIHRVSSWGDSWVVAKNKKIKSRSSLHLDGNIFEDLVADVKNFWDSREWCESMGISHKRGYLLYGPPGNGKTSTILCLASELKASVYIIPKLSKDIVENLTNLIECVKPNSFIIFEDIDAMLTNGRQSKKPKGNKSKNAIANILNDENNDEVNISVLLNALDGISTPDGHVVFMTTNHIDVLDDALIRPGRIDKKIPIDNPTIDQKRRLYSRFFPTHTDSMVNKFIETTKKNESMADLQERLLSMFWADR